MFNSKLHIMGIDKETILLVKVPLYFTQIVWISYVKYCALQLAQQ